ncbi:peptide ABC transporter ATP-binding protein [Hoeflea sp. BAL378]|uniref:ABC transporter ATP-binding protein n=1 Tax=Hoeflea sp. BAL378 TaxID=1547437 RepID=UPI0005129E4C|nr:ABC transporter ATP-binding protein [Hoeflea sp. BAL378]KGF68406.1 peptide ABC transporter ATP-binding protein [Hoeflea sp. BAL378]
MSPLLSVENLRISFPSRQGPVEVVRGVSFTLGRERLGIVGESGSGKSQTGRAILGLTPVSGKATADRLEFDGIDLRNATPAKWRSLRGARMSMVMQDPKFSLNPVMTIGKQLMEAVKLHGGASEARDKSVAMLEAVQIRDPGRVMAAYPHELSGGMGQRAMIAMMLVTEPDLLIADEPTSALDVTVQIEVLRILDRLVSERGMGLIFISHDLELVSTFCDRVLVMYAGRVVEELDAAKMNEAKHPYTRGLLGCLPKIVGDVRPLPVLARDAAWLE